MDERAKAMVRKVLEIVRSQYGLVSDEDIVVALMSAAATYAVVDVGADNSEVFGGMAADLFLTAYETFGERNIKKAQKATNSNAN